MENGNKVLEKTETEVWNAIAAFEQILEAIPNDRVALETVYEAYEMIGDNARALEYLHRLAQVIIEERARDMAPKVIESLNRLGPEDPESAKLRGAIEQLTEETVPEVAPPTVEADAAIPTKSGDINTELTLAWNLMQSEELSNEEYSTIVQDLSDTWSKDVEVPVSVLHVLEDRQSNNIDRVLVFLSKESGLPLISLRFFDVQPADTDLLPERYMTRLGAIVFDTMGKDVLVAILNPYNQELRNDIQRRLNKTCHFYLVSASDYNFALNHVKRSRAEDE